MKPLFIGEPAGNQDFTWIYNALKEIARISREETAVLAGDGLTGGGGLGEDQTLNVGAGTGIAVTADAVSLAAIAAHSFLANATGSSAVPTAVAPNSLTEKTAIVGDDLILIADSEASFALKKAKRSNVDTAFTLSNDSVTNTILADMAPYTLKARNAGTSGDPSDMDVSALTAKTALVGNDLFLIQDSAASNAFKKVARSDLTATIWFRDGTGKAAVNNLLNQSNVADSSGTIDVDSLFAGVVPTHAQALILTIEVGYSTLPAGGDGAVSLRVMPDGYNLGAPLDRAKVQQVVINSTAVDVHAMHVLMPIHPSRRTFFWARQSTDSATANKMSIIDLWGYTI